MQTLIIQGVRNGWIVRPFNPCSFLTVDDRDECHVFNDLKDLQAALPDLLKTHYPTQAAYPIQSIDTTENGRFQDGTTKDLTTK